MVTRWLHWILLCAWTVCILAGGWLRPTSISWAQDRPRSEMGVLLLERNRVMQGRITESKETYSVEQGTAGTVIVPKAQVRFQGADMHAIYIFLQDGLPKDATSNDHVELARWCIGNKMFPEARLELESALELEPDRDDIRRNLSTLDAYVKRPSREPQKVKSLSPADRIANLSGMNGPSVELLGGLSREAGQQFTSRIQPIIMHNCTNAACHGPSAEHSLRFSIVRTGSNTQRGTSEKNLLALLKFVDQERPRSSPLWKVLTTNHNARGRSIFTGSKGPQQLQACKDWMLSLSGEEEDLEADATPVVNSSGGKKVARTRHSSAAKSKDAQQVAEDEDEPPRTRTVKDSRPEMIQRTVGTETSQTKTSARNGIGKSYAQKLLGSDNPTEVIDTNETDVEPIVSTNREPVSELPPEDPFDPEVFNRRQRQKRNAY